MPLPVTVGLIVLGVIILVAIVGSLIENAEEKVEQSAGNRDRRT